MSLELLMENWKVQTGRAAASAGSNKVSELPSALRQFLKVQAEPDKQYRATKPCPVAAPGWEKGSRASDSHSNARDLCFL